MNRRNSLWAGPACDPELAPRLRQLACSRNEVVQPTHRWFAAAAPGIKGGVLGSWSASAAFLGAAVAELPGTWAGIWLLAATAAATTATVVGFWFSPTRQLAASADQVVYPYQLDHPCQAILARAQSAVARVLDSEVRAAGLLEADEAILRRHEWELAKVLRNVTALRGVHARQPPAGELTAGVLGAQRRALEVAQSAAAGRAAALERFADQVAAADEAHRDWRQALELSGLNDRYLDLVAATAADELAVAEISELTTRATITVSALQDTLRAASQTAELLAI